MPTPTVNTSPIVGYSGGQTRYVHVRDVSNGYDLYTSGANTSFSYFASLTKMMTVLLVMEYKSSVLDSETVTLDATDVAQPYSGISESDAGFINGDTTTFRGLLYGILLPSGFDACQAAARIVGDYIYAQAGNTGTSGRTRFIERMNARAAELGMSSTTFYDAFGNGTDANVPNANVSTARDLSLVCKSMMDYPDVRTIARTPTFGVAVGGSSARTITMTGYNRFINGPTNNQSGVSDSTVLGGKNGTWVIGGSKHFNLSQLWRSPNGTEVVFTVLNATTIYELMLDVRGLMYTIVKDFPYLDDSAIPGDSSYASVKLLVGFDGSIVDESAVGRTLTTNSVTVGNPLIYKADTSGGGVYNDAGDYITAADAADLRVGSGDMTVEGWFSGDGTHTPASEFVFFAKAEHTPSVNREYLVEVFNNSIELFASADGTNWQFFIGYTMEAAETNTFFNGAPRHVALVKSGTTWALYVNGERFANTLSFDAVGTTAKAVIGYYASAASFIGGTDDFRITMGVARYTPAMVTLDPRRFPRSATAVAAPAPQGTSSIPFAPPGGRNGLPMGYSFAPVSALPGTLKLQIAYPDVHPAGQAAAVVAGQQIIMPPFPRDAIVRGPWQRTPFRIEGRNEYILASVAGIVPTTPQVYPPPFPAGAPVLGPWNLFGRHVLGAAPGATTAPVPPPVGPPPPPPPPQTGAIGGERSQVPRVPVDLNMPMGRLRSHTQKVAGLLNSLLRQGYIKLTDTDEYAVVGGGFALQRAPVASDDASKGAVVGGTFVDTLHNDVYICTNNSVGSAIWRKISVT